MAQHKKQTASLRFYRESVTRGELSWQWDINKYSLLALLVAAELLVTPVVLAVMLFPLSWAFALILLGMWMFAQGVAVIATFAYSTYILFEWLLASDAVKKRYKGNFTAIISFAGLVFLANLFVIIYALARLQASSA